MCVMDINLLKRESPSLSPDWFNDIKLLSLKILNMYLFLIVGKIIPKQIGTMLVSCFSEFFYLLFLEQGQRLLFSVLKEVFQIN